MGSTGDGGETEQYSLDVLNTDKGLMLLLMLLLMMGMPLQQLRKAKLYL